MLHGQCLERVKARKRGEPLTVGHDRAQLTPIKQTAWKIDVPCLQPRSSGSPVLVAATLSRTASINAERANSKDL